MLYFLKFHDFLTPHAYTWCLQTSKNNFIKNVTLYDFYINTTLTLRPTQPPLILQDIYSWQKLTRMCKHSEFPYHAFAHCRGFAPAALRGAGTSISVSLSGLPLSGPLRILGLVVRYTANCLIRRRLILRPCV